MVNKVNLSLIESEGTGQVISDAAGLSVLVQTPDDTTLTGNYDRSTGAITLSIPQIGRLTITGLPTVNDIGYGEQGLPGDEGRDGVDGLMGRDGLRGVDGCPGPRGQDGRQGKQGPIGQRGAQGFRGEPGPTGPTGADGVFSVYVQDNDPSEDQDVKPGTIWVRP